MGAVAEKEIALDSPVESLPGIGPRRAERLREAGVVTVEDLLFHVPFRYEDRSRCARVGELVAGLPATIHARVSTPRLVRTRRRDFSFVQAVLEDDTGGIRAVWYNQPWLERLLTGRTGFFHGEPRLAKEGREGLGALVLQNPEIELVEDADPGEPSAGAEVSGEASGAPRSPGSHGSDVPADQLLHTGRIVPVYRSLAGLTSRSLRRIIAGALDALGDGIEDFLPSEIRRKLSLTWRGSAVRGIHFPPPDLSLEELTEGTSPFHRRLAFEEFFLLQATLGSRRRRAHAQARGFRYRFTQETRAKLASLLPFALTAAQKRVLREIREDMESPAPMNRLLQGDVGSGKTVVAALALAIAADNGLQGALMAPTELLAEQHFRALSALLAPGGWSVRLLTSSVRGAERRTVIEALAGGETVIVVGTHALLQGTVNFSRLGLVVVDEEHRFGVAQRQQLLRSKGYRPDLLVMTATPIPRSLALTVYGDLDQSLLDQMPPGRRTIKTLLRSEEHRERVYDGIRRELEGGRQAFLIYPLVEESDESGMKAAVEMAGRLQSGPFSRFRVGLMHGRMKREEREEAMAAFAQGKTHLLVATTVVEVGIDVPNATVLVVEHPERFGLAQLHQLRGRVGRGSAKSYCILLAPGGLSDEARRRLEVLVAESDGFRIAEKDLALRGAGDLLGTRQHGLPVLRIGDPVRDAVLMNLARKEAEAWLGRVESGETKAPRALLERLQRRNGT